MAIAFEQALGYDNSATGGYVISGLSISGDDLAIVCFALSEANGTTVTSYNWDDGSGGSAQALTQIGNYQYIDLNANIQRLSLWGLLAPNTSNSRLIATFSAATFNVIGGVLYSGVKQTNAFTAGSNGAINNVTSFQVQDTSDADGSWHVGVVGDNNNTLTVGADTTERQDVGNNTVMLVDSNATVASAATHTFNFNQSVSGARNGWVTTMMRPVPPPGPANLKTYNTNALANIKTINTNAIANVKTLNTNA